MPANELTMVVPIGVNVLKALVDGFVARFITHVMLF